MGGRLLIEKKGEGTGRGRGTRHRSLSRGNHFVFWRDRQPTGHTRFDAPRFFHSPGLEASNRNRPRINSPLSIRGIDTSLGLPVYAPFALTPLNQKKIDKSGRNHRALPRCQVAWLMKGMMDRIDRSPFELPTSVVANLGVLHKCRSIVRGVEGEWECRRGSGRRVRWR